MGKDPLVNHYEFLERLHGFLAPDVYLEIGVQFGYSLELAKNCKAIGVDPYPQTHVNLNMGNAIVIPKTSDDFFADADLVKSLITPGTLDFAYIDGEHKWEFAARDFLNIEQYLNKSSVVAFDDVLPYTFEMTSRTPIQGDWTGDVWKVAYWLRENRRDLITEVIDTTPTGTLLVWGFNHKKDLDLESIPSPEDYRANENPPEEIMNRDVASSSDLAIHLLKDWLWR